MAWALPDEKGFETVKRQTVTLGSSQAWALPDEKGFETNVT